MSINQEAIIKFIKVRGGVVKLRELSHFNSKDIESLQYQRCVQIGRGSTGIEVELLNELVNKKDDVEVKKEIEKKHKEIASNIIYKQETKKKKDDFSLRSKIETIIKDADYPLTAYEIKKILVTANGDSISAYLSHLVRIGTLVCSQNRRMFRHYTTPDRQHLLIGLDRKPKPPKVKKISCPVSRLDHLATMTLKHKVLDVVIKSESPMTLRHVQTHFPDVNIKTISAYLSLFAREGVLRCSCITKNNIKYYTTPDKTHLLHKWNPKIQSQKVTSRVLNVLEETGIALGIHGIVALAEVSRKSAWAVIHKLKKDDIIEIKRTGYSVYIALKTNISAMNSLNQVAGYTLRDQIILAIKNQKHRTDDIMNELINQYSRPHIHRVLREMKADGALRSQIKGRYTLYYLV